MSTPTLHNSAGPEDFARTVLMPGDPLRARFIAETYLENARLVNDVRGIQGYTGEYKGKRVSVMASGMGIPTMGIYSMSCSTFIRWSRSSGRAVAAPLTRNLRSGTW